MPLGSQTGIALGSLYNDDLLTNDGYWDLSQDQRFVDAYVGPEIGTAREAALARVGLRQALDWMVDHRMSLPTIVLIRVRAFWWPQPRPDQRAAVVLMILGLIYLLLAHHSLGLPLMFILSQTAAIVLGANDYNGRYMFALEPLSLSLEALGLLLVINIILKLKCLLLGKCD